MNKRLIMMIIVLSVLLVLIFAFLWWSNTALIINEFKITSHKIPGAFSGYRITQISDLHNTTIGKDNEKLVEKIKTTSPDMIVITGDLIDSRWTNIDVAVSFMEKITQIAPVYYVNGNNEARMKNYALLREKLKSAGVNVMENEVTEISVDDNVLTLIGLNDTGFALDKDIGDTLKTVLPDNNNYKILLAHRPEYFDKYKGVDFIFSGHTHGGQIRLPFIGGLFAPGQGFLPEYDSGLYTDGDRTMIVNRGVGNSLFPVRFNNRPEIVVVELRKE